MPYRRAADIPKPVRDALPDAAQRIWWRAFNSAESRYGTGDEGRLASIAWGAVRNAGYEKDGETWRLAKAEDPAKTPAEPDERISGSSRNPEGSASGTRGGISIDEKTEAALRRKVEEHNEKNTNASQRATLGQLKAVYRRGAGAFSTSHRPGMTRNQWAMARVNAFLGLLRTGKPGKASYVTDNDLLPDAHPRSTMEKAETYKPTAAMAENAKRALKVRASKPPSQRGMTSVGIARARQLMGREALSEETVRRMKAYFDRHAIDKEGETWSEQGKGWQAWHAWGGDEGRSWAEAIVRRLNRAEKSLEVAKMDEDKRLVFGWASVIENDDGSPLEDLQGDVIKMEELESAAYRFVLDSRKAGEMHDRTEGIGRLVESFVVTPEKAEALGMTRKGGWWVGFKIDDDSTWEQVKKGTFRMFSIGGKARRE